MLYKMCILPVSAEETELFPCHTFSIKLNWRHSPPFDLIFKNILIYGERARMAFFALSWLGAENG